MKIGSEIFKAVLDTGATLSIVAQRPLKLPYIGKTNLWPLEYEMAGISVPLGVGVTVCFGDEEVTQHCRVVDNEASDIVIGRNFPCKTPLVKLLSLQRPYALHCTFALFSVPLELSRREESGCTDVDKYKV